MKFTLIKTTYLLMFALILIGKMPFLFLQNALADFVEKDFMEELLDISPPDKIASLCTKDHLASSQSVAVASNSKNDLTRLTSGPSIENQDHPFKNPCSQTMKPLQRLLILPPFFEANTETRQNPTDRRKIWEILHSRFIQNKQLKVVSWEKMHHFIKSTPKLSPI